MAPLQCGIPLCATPFLRGEKPFTHSAKSSAIPRRSSGAACQGALWSTIDPAHARVARLAVADQYHSTQRLKSSESMLQPHPLASLTSTPLPHKPLTTSSSVAGLLVVCWPIAFLQTLPNVYLSLRCASHCALHKQMRLTAHRPLHKTRPLLLVDPTRCFHSLHIPTSNHMCITIILPNHQ